MMCTFVRINAYAYSEQHTRRKYRKRVRNQKTPSRQSDIASRPALNVYPTGERSYGIFGFKPDREIMRSISFTAAMECRGLHFGG